MSNNDFSPRSFQHWRTWDDDDLTTYGRRSYNNKFVNDIDNKYYWKKEYVIKLFIKEASNIYPLKSTFPYSSKGIYRVIVSDECGREFSTRRRVGRPAPVWNDDIEIRFSSYPIGQKLKLMVVRENYYDDPGTSTGEVVVGRATIPVPVNLGKCYEKKNVIELAKLVGLEKRVEALISFQILLTARIREEDITPI